jgi:hypothetical protein
MIRMPENRRKVLVVDYDPSWTDEFELLRWAICPAVRGVATDYILARRNIGFFGAHTAAHPRREYTLGICGNHLINKYII